MENYRNKFKNEVKNIYTIENIFLSLIEKEAPDEASYNYLFDTYKRVKNNKKDISIKEISLLGKVEDINDYMDEIIFNKKCERFLNSLFSNKYKHLYSEKLLLILKSYARTNELYSVKELISSSMAQFLNKSAQEYYYFVEDILEKNNNFNKSYILNLINNTKGAELLKEKEDKLYVLINNYEASEIFGSKNWCISKSDLIFDDYKLQNNTYIGEKLFSQKNGIFLKTNIFIFVFDFKKGKNENKLLGYTINIENNTILYCMNEADKNFKYSKAENEEIINLANTVNKNLIEYKIEKKINYYSLNFPNFFTKVNRQLISEFNHYSLSGNTTYFIKNNISISDIISMFACHMSFSDGFSVKINNVEDFICLGGLNIKEENFIFLRFKNFDVFEECILKYYNYRRKFKKLKIFLKTFNNNKLIKIEKEDFLDSCLRKSFNSFFEYLRSGKGNRVKEDLNNNCIFYINYFFERKPEHIREINEELFFNIINSGVISEDVNKYFKNFLKSCNLDYISLKKGNLNCFENKNLKSILPLIHLLLEAYAKDVERLDFSILRSISFLKDFFNLNAEDSLERVLNLKDLEKEIYENKLKYEPLLMTFPGYSEGNSDMVWENSDIYFILMTSVHSFFKIINLIKKIDYFVLSSGEIINIYKKTENKDNFIHKSCEKKG